MQFPDIRKQASELTIADVKILMTTAADHSGAIMLATERGSIVSTHTCRPVAPFGPAGVFGCGSIAFLRADKTDAGAAWCLLQAWSLGLSAAPETLLQIFADGKKLPLVGKHVMRLLKNDIELVQFYALGKNHDGIELDVGDDGFVIGAHIIDCAPGDVYNVTGTKKGATFGAAVDPEEILAVLRIQAFISARNGK